MMWRGAADFPAFLGGRTMIIAGGMSGKLVLYPIAEGATPDTRLTNWVVNVRVSRHARIRPARRAGRGAGGSTRCCRMPAASRSPASTWSR